MLIKYSYIKYVPVRQITKCVSSTEKFCASYRTIPLILYARCFLFADVTGVALKASNTYVHFIPIMKEFCTLMDSSATKHRAILLQNFLLDLITAEKVEQVNNLKKKECPKGKRVSSAPPTNKKLKTHSNKH
jgi:hypothetical protein